MYRFVKKSPICNFLKLPIPYLARLKTYFKQNYLGSGIEFGFETFIMDPDPIKKVSDPDPRYCKKA
jgi:hypothetical protein